jgi:hydroxypyruvate reductase
MFIENPATFLRSLFDAAIAAADPARCVPKHLPTAPEGRTVVVGAGKASAAMALAVENHWQGPLDGLIVTRYGHGTPCRRIEIVEAAHPVPDARGREAAIRIAGKVAGLSENDLVLCLLSGGGSALLAAPAPGLGLEDKQELNRQLLACGAPIAEMNCVRKHLSALKGGRLAVLAHPARVVSLIISDVPGDDPAIVASGPTLPDPTTRENALAIIARYGIGIPDHVRRFLASPEAETPKPGDPKLNRAEARIIAAPAQSLAAAKTLAMDRGLKIIDLGDRVEGEASVVAKAHAALALGTAPPALILSGGETTVTLRGQGRGGRNTEYLLALAVALDGNAGCWAIAGDTDGIDGSENNAGAILAPDALARALALGVDARAALAGNDGYGFFDKLDALVVTGPTRSFVNVFRAFLVA